MEEATAPDEDAGRGGPGDEVLRLASPSKTKMKYIRRSGWHVMAEPPDYDGSNDELLEPFPIDEETLIYLIQGSKQSDHINVKMVKTDDDDNDE